MLPYPAAHKLQSEEASCSAAVVPLEVVFPISHGKQSESATLALYIPVAHMTQLLFVATPDKARPYPTMHILHCDDTVLPVLVVVVPVLQASQLICDPSLDDE